MKGLSELLQEVLLNESVSVDDINSAIDSHNRVIINYRSKDGDEANGARVIEVYAYGLTKAGNPVIRAFQPYGDTTSKVPSWKFFRLDRITDWKPTEQIFSEPASDYYRGLGDFNPNGDGTMSTVYKIAKFGDEVEGLDTKDENSGPKLKSDVFKTDTEKQMARTKEQLKNPITLSDLKAQQGFKDQKVTSTMPKGPVTKDTEPEVYKTPTERGMERLRQQLQNPTKIDLSQFEKGKPKDETEKLQQALGDTSQKMTVGDLNKKLMDMNNGDTETNEPEVYKSPTEYGMERLRQQLENPTKIDLSKFNRKR